MTRISNDKKIEYINTRFHQYFDLSVNTNITTTEQVNLVIPIQQLFFLGDKLSTSTNYHHDIEITNNFDIDSTLAKYNDTNIEKELRAVCTRVIDGDTIEVKIINEDGTTYKDKVRLVGVNTPEIGQNGYDDSKIFLEKVVYSKRYFNHLYITPEEQEVVNNKHIYLNVDKKKERDPYNRLLAVVIADNKNINEVLLKEKIAEVMYIPPSEFNPNDWKDPGSSISLYNYKNDDLALLSPYFRPDMKNIVFTPRDDSKTIYRYEIYKGVIYLKLDPYSQYIRMHILPKAYDCSNEVLIFKDDDLKDYTNSSNYKIYPDRNNINAYFQINGEDRDRAEIIDRDYDINDWPEETDIDISKTFVDFKHDISDSTKSFSNLEICAGYRYNNTSPYYALHYTGIRDNQGRPEDRCTLIDANIDKIKNSNSNIITQMTFIDPDSDYTNPENDILYLKHNVKVKKEFGNNDHLSDIGKIFHKRLKYINDLLYVEEEIDDSYSIDSLDHIKKKQVYGFKEWFDPLFPEFDINLEGGNSFRIQGEIEHEGNIEIYIDNSLYKTIQTDSSGKFNSGIITDINPGEHIFYIIYKDPTSTYPEIRSIDKKVNLNKIATHLTDIHRSGDLNSVTVETFLLDEYNHPVKNEPVEIIFIFSNKPNILFTVLTDENGKISLTKTKQELSNSLPNNFSFKYYGNEIYKSTS